MPPSAVLTRVAAHRKYVHDFLNMTATIVKDQGTSEVPVDTTPQAKAPGNNRPAARLVRCGNLLRSGDPFPVSPNTT